MPDERKKMFSKKGTGTVPKITHRNNSCANQSDFHRNLSNNLDLNWGRYYSNYSTNSRNCQHLNSYSMDAPISEDYRENEVVQLNMPVATNGMLSTASTSGSNSRRDSVGTIPKCDNVKKCPGNKQIQDKLNQIREYLRVTSSLMSSIKNNDDQASIKERQDFEKMMKDLKDSEAKLLALLDDPIISENSELEEENRNMDVAVSEHMQRFSQLLDIVACQQDKFNNVYNTNNGPVENGVDNDPGYQRNELEEKVELTNRKVQILREQQNALINLKRKAENQLRDARQAQENLMSMQQQQQCQKSANYLRNEDFADKNIPDTRIDSTIRELEDRLHGMRVDSRQSAESVPDNAPSETDFLQEQMENSTRLLQLLENQDPQLSSEHIQLQEKLHELHNKKLQIDQLAQQLQNLGDDDDEDIGNQVRKIVTMKQQLSSLKDLLEIVKNTEFTLLDSQNVNESDCQDNAHGVCSKTDNIRQDVRTHSKQKENMRLENNAARVNEQWLGEKQSNKSLLKIQEREKVLAELKAKKRELEEIMYKQKDRTLINNDVCSETSVNKSEGSANHNMFDNVVMSWLPAQPNLNQMISTYSSDEGAEEDMNEYSDINSTAEATIGSITHPPAPLSTSFSKHRSQDHLDVSQIDRMRHSSPRVYERSVPIVSNNVPLYQRERSVSNSGAEADGGKMQVQKQLELIQSVCQSLLEQQGAPNAVHQLRNNLTPSPMYTDPRSYVSQDAPVMNSFMDLSHLNTPPVNPQCFSLNEMANNQNMLAANTLQTQAFLLNTVNQCCQMLWYQQREIAALRNMICTWQDQMVNIPMEQDLPSGPMPSAPYIFPIRPLSSLSNMRAPSQPRNLMNQKVNQVSAACSLPNLNPTDSRANLDNTYVNQNNSRSSPSARLLESSLNNSASLNAHSLSEPPANNTVLPNINVSSALNQPLPSQIWNGQALNNQVAPGNRANNYWDNFRSYSRQNLLSTSAKSNEGLQNVTSVGILDPRDRNSYDRSHSFPLQHFTVPKLNMVHNESSNTSEESTPRRRHFKASQNTTVSNKAAAVPPDVLNVNHNSVQKANEQAQFNDIQLGLNALESNADSGSDPRVFKEFCDGPQRNRNEWHNFEQVDNLPKSKLFEELRDNVYKEVANLISANENRPHFLIQLFRDLQHINSDPLRGRTLQSIQTVITTSLNSLENRGANRQNTMQQQNGDQEVVQVDSEYFSLQPTALWPQSPASTSRESSNLELENDDPDIHNILKTIFGFLKPRNCDTLDQEQIELLKSLIIKTAPFTQILSNTNIQERTFHKHFSAVLHEVIEKFRGRRIGEIRTDLLKAISDVLLGEFSFIYMVQENIHDSSESSHAHNNPVVPDNSLMLNLQPQQVTKSEEGNTPQMQNGDLAEADQSRIEMQDEEGAVGGILNALSDAIAPSVSSEPVEPDITDLPKIDFSVNTEAEVEFAELGLDQVPTRLTSLQSRSNTPSRDRPNSSRSDHMDHF